MNNEFINARDQLFLQHVKDYLLSQSISGTVLEASHEIPQNLYLGQLPVYGTVNIMYIPLPEDHYEDTRLLQFYAPVLDEVNPEKRSDLLNLLNGVNLACPIGAFSINAKNEIGFKYVFPINRFDIMEEGPFLDIFNLYLDCLTSMREAISDLNAGKVVLEDALTNLTD